MTRSCFSAFGRSLLCLPVLALAACVGLGSSEEAADRYVLTLPPAPALEASARGTLHLRVLQPEVGPGLDTQKIAVLEDGMHLAYLAGAAWAEPLPALLSQSWIAALRQSGQAASVSADMEGTKADRLVQVTAARFQLERANEAAPLAAHVLLEVKLLEPASRAILTVQTADVQRPCAGDAALTCLISANADATGQLIEVLGPALRKQAKR